MEAQEHYGLRLDEIARIWKAGCIIRAVFLDEIKKTFKEEPGLVNLLLAERFKEAIRTRQEAWRRVLTAAIRNGIGDVVRLVPVWPIMSTLPKGTVP